MARSDAGTMFRSLPTDQKLGDYNGITKVPADTTVEFTGSNAGAAFICENVSNVVIHGSSGGSIPGTSLTADTLYPIGTKKSRNW